MALRLSISQNMLGNKACQLRFSGRATDLQVLCHKKFMQPVFLNYSKFKIPQDSSDTHLIE